MEEGVCSDLRAHTGVSRLPSPALSSGESAQILSFTLHNSQLRPLLCITSLNQPLSPTAPSHSLFSDSKSYQPPSCPLALPIFLTIPADHGLSFHKPLLQTNALNHPVPDETPRCPAKITGGARHGAQILWGAAEGAQPGEKEA